MTKLAGVYVLACMTTVAHALPAPGTKVKTAYVVDTAGVSMPIPNPKLPVVIQYEDQDAGKQNEPVYPLMSHFTRVDSNRAVFKFMAVADVEKWNWWPAKKHALKRIREIEKKTNTTVYIDWTGDTRRALGLTRHKSGILVIASDGSVLFAGEGPLTTTQLEELRKQVLGLGAISDGK